MQTYEILVRGRAVEANSADMTLVRTSVGIDQVHVLFDNAEWLDFPITATFGQGDDVITQSLVVVELEGNIDYVAEAYITVPWEVIDQNGEIRVTFQGTDADGRHIITAKGAPLSVIEAGDVETGDAPSDAPTVDQWQQAYADAMAAVNSAASLVANLQDQLAAIVGDAEQAIDTSTDDALDRLTEYVESHTSPATTESLGVVQIGDGIDVTTDGVISIGNVSGLSDRQKNAIANLVKLARVAFGTNVELSGIGDDIVLKADSVPMATVVTVGGVIPDGTTIKMDADGVIHSYLGAVETATIDSVGSVKPDGTTITIDADGTIHGTEQTVIATTNVAGKVKPDGETISVDASGKISVIRSQDDPHWEIRTDGQGRRRLAIVIPEG